MTQHHMGQGTWEGWSTSHICQPASKMKKAAKSHMVNCNQGASADPVRAHRAHKGLPTSDSEKNNVIRPGNQPLVALGESTVKRNPHRRQCTAPKTPVFNTTIDKRSRATPPR